MTEQTTAVEPTTQSPINDASPTTSSPEARDATPRIGGAAVATAGVGVVLAAAWLAHQDSLVSAAMVIAVTVAVGAVFVIVLRIGKLPLALRLPPPGRWRSGRKAQRLSG